MGYGLQATGYRLQALGDGGRGGGALSAQFAGPRERRVRRCFTLVEIVVVLAILAAAALLVPASLGRLSVDLRLREAGRRIANAIEWAQSEAVLRGRTYRVFYDLDDQAWWMGFVEPGPALDPRSGAKREHAFTRRRFPRGVRLASVSLGENTTLERGVCYVNVWPSGATSPHEVRLANDEGSEVVLKTEPLTGLVTCEGERE